jgi:hypothetical protein
MLVIKMLANVHFMPISCQFPKLYACLHENLNVILSLPCSLTLNVSIQTQNTAIFKVL